MVVEIPLNLFSHHRKIANLYKKYLRTLESNIFLRENYRFEARLTRAEFDLIYCERDVRVSKQMLKEKENELARITVKAAPFPSSPEGPLFNRYLNYEDQCLDYWHPLEKAMYPEYFARRELRKQQYLEMWERMHSPPKPE